MEPATQTPPADEGGPRPRTLRRRVHFILEVDRLGDRLSRQVDKGLIVLNVVAAVVQTQTHLYERCP